MSPPRRRDLGSTRMQKVRAREESGGWGMVWFEYLSQTEQEVLIWASTEVGPNAPTLQDYDVAISMLLSEEAADLSMTGGVRSPRGD